MAAPSDMRLAFNISNENKICFTFHISRVGGKVWLHFLGKIPILLKAAKLHWIQLICVRFHSKESNLDAKTASPAEKHQGLLIFLPFMQQYNSCTPLEDSSICESTRPFLPYLCHVTQQIVGHLAS